MKLLDLRFVRGLPAALLAREDLDHPLGLEVRTREDMPAEWAGAQMNRVSALSSLGDLIGDPTRLEAAIAGYDAALTIMTREDMPADWAQTQMNRANALLSLGDLIGDPARLAAKVKWHPGELYPRVGFIVTNLSRLTERVTKFYQGRGTAEQYIKEGKNAINWTRLSCHGFRNNAVRLQLHALAYNLGNFLRTLALPEAVENWSLTTLREKLIKIGAKVVHHGRYITFQMAEVAIPRPLFAEILHLIDGLRPAPLPP